MLYSKLVGKTSRDRPRSVRSRGQELLRRGGFIAPLAQGLYSFLPLGYRVVQRITDLVRSEMRALDGQEVLLPVVNPLELWNRSGRESILGRDMIRFRDASSRAMVLAPTHEEAMVELVKSMIGSYRDLPLFLYQFQTKYRNELRPRGGLLRTREFVMNDGYSFHRSFTDLNNFLPKVYAAYERILKSCRVPFLTAEAAVGAMMGDRSFEFLMPFDGGDDTVITCPGCSYAANREVAVGTVAVDSGAPKPTATVHVGDVVSIAEVAAKIGVPTSRLGKTMIYSCEAGIVFAVVRGDQMVSEEKLARVLNVAAVRRADSQELSFLGIDPLVASPLGLPSDLLALDGGIRTVVDTVVAESSNLVFAANEPEVRYVNVNFGRDYDGEIVADISQVGGGARCVDCNTPLVLQRVIELAHVFRLGDYYSRRLRLTLTDSNKRRFNPLMGAYGIGIGRLMAATAEANNDRRGLNWPHHLAPFRVYLAGIGRSPRVARGVEAIHDELADCLLDDRMVSISTKFRDADLIGVPYRVIVARRFEDDGEVEILTRGSTRVIRAHASQIASAIEQIAGSLS
ncbi:MAG: proline--tRNA ligase [Spirochaetaceae bacterium]|nr:MAG: proline--tRNA ligase [Spirochaetaceae bacterium]